MEWPAQALGSESLDALCDLGNQLPQFPHQSYGDGFMKLLALRLPHSTSRFPSRQSLLIFRKGKAQSRYVAACCRYSAFSGPQEPFHSGSGKGPVLSNRTPWSWVSIMNIGDPAPSQVNGDNNTRLIAVYSGNNTQKGSAWHAEVLNKWLLSYCNTVH